MHNKSNNVNWDIYWNNLPEDLKSRLSLHDFKRLGDLFLEAMVQETKNEIARSYDER